MEKKWIVLIVMVILALSALIIVQSNDKTDYSGEILSFNVSEGSSELDQYSERLSESGGYNRDTLEWMKSLENKKVFFGNDSIIIMDSADAGKLPKAPFITDVDVYNHFTAEVVESHNLGGDYPTAYYVKNVNFINQEILGNGLA